MRKIIETIRKTIVNIRKYQKRQWYLSEKTKETQGKQEKHEENERRTTPNARKPVPRNNRKHKEVSEEKHKENNRKIIENIRKTRET